MYIFGIDVGGTSIKIGFFDSNNVLIEKWSIKTNKDTLFIDLTNNIKEYLEKKNIGFEQILGYGIGIPGIIKNKIALSCVNLNWSNVNVENEFRSAIGYDAYVEVYNDANLAAYGEYSLYDNYDTIAFITLGTGVGGGVVSEGIIQEGANGQFAEFGHIKIDHEFNFNCCCGNHGCLETLSSATGITKLANHLCRIKNIDKQFHNCKEVVDASKNDDEIAKKAFNIACENIAKALEMLSVIIDPNAFIIGGGVSEAGEYLIETIREYFLHICSQNSKKINILLSKLRNDAGITGGAALITNKIKGGNKNG